MRKPRNNRKTNEIRENGERSNVNVKTTPNTTQATGSGQSIEPEVQTETIGDNNDLPYLAIDYDDDDDDLFSSNNIHQTSEPSNGVIAIPPNNRPTTTEVGRATEKAINFK